MSVLPTPFLARHFNEYDAELHDPSAQVLVIQRYDAASTSNPYSITVLRDEDEWGTDRSMVLGLYPTYLAKGLAADLMTLGHQVTRFAHLDADLARWLTYNRLPLEWQSVMDSPEFQQRVYVLSKGTPRLPRQRTMAEIEAYAKESAR